MSFDPLQFFEQAERMLESLDDEELSGPAHEAVSRTAVIVLYYAVFHVALDVATDCGYIAQKKESSHVHLWKWFGEQGSRTISKEGFRLSRVRQAANYKLETTFRANPHMFLIESLNQIEVIAKFYVERNPEPPNEEEMQNKEAFQA